MFDFGRVADPPALVDVLVDEPDAAPMPHPRVRIRIRIHIRTCGVDRFFRVTCAMCIHLLYYRHLSVNKMGDTPALLPVYCYVAHLQPHCRMSDVFIIFLLLETGYFFLTKMHGDGW